MYSSFPTVFHLLCYIPQTYSLTCLHIQYMFLKRRRKKKEEWKTGGLAYSFNHTTTLPVWLLGETTTERLENCGFLPFFATSSLCNVSYYRVMDYFCCVVLCSLLNLNSIMCDHYFAAQYPLVWVETPTGSRIAQWINVDNTAGLIHKVFTLSDEPEEVGGLSTTVFTQIHIKTCLQTYFGLGVDEA